MNLKKYILWAFMGSFHISPSEENSSQYFQTEKPGFIEDDSVINQKFLLPKFIIRDLIVKKHFRKICANFHTNLQTMHT